MMTLRILRVVLVGAMLMPWIYSQSATGSIAGTVVDASGAVVPNAGITVRNEKTGQSRKVMSNEQGNYVVTQLGPATYAVTGEANGMAPAPYSGVTFQVGQERTLNITVHPASLASEVNVS